MIINHQHKYLFVEPPFTGSTAIADELVETYGGEPVLEKHAQFSEYRAAHGNPRGYFVFASNRNPLDQAVSEFVKLQNNHKGQFTRPELFARNGGYLRDATLEEFAWVQEQGAEFSEYFQRYKNKLFNNWFLLGHHRFNYVMNFEDIVGEFDRVLRLIGIEPVRPLPHRNPTKDKKLFTEYYPPETWEQAFRCYGPYMDKWGFSFPPGWGKPKIPLGARLRFAALDGGVGGVARFVNLSPKSKTVQRIKHALQAMGR